MIARPATYEVQGRAGVHYGPAQPPDNRLKIVGVTVSQRRAMPLLSQTPLCGSPRNQGDGLRTYINQCYICATTKPHWALKTQGNLRCLKQPWNAVAVDILRPHPRSAQGKIFLLVVTNLFSWWTEAYPLANAMASTVVKTKQKKQNSEFFPHYLYHQGILSDNGTQFTGTKWKAACFCWWVSSLTTGNYHFQGNPMERRNQELKKGSMSIWETITRNGIISTSQIYYMH
ncbi:hypothetical protein PR048_019877 [Dryococelus australis]|uniref:Integrase catalytic domain-containing protein n=1 Tax=Dryococelus australis TaxID=614101 RepID=A0ABQ9H4P7_9NEOP|nr:hypothetical protein PR048_019877 [Dryococelus australis]